MAGDPNKAYGMEDMPGGPYPQETIVKFYIKSDDMGYFVGECLGLGFFEAHMDCGDCGPDERPCEFDSRGEAQEFLDTWMGGPCGCYVTDVPSGRVYND